MLKVLISIELMATGASMNFVLLASSLSKELGEALLILAFSTDTCVTGIILALLVVVSRRYGTSDIRRLSDIENDEKTEYQKEGGAV
jgi:NADH:ubiquinone oxidoreductase subunit K